MKYNKNKKAMAFWYLLPVVMFLCYVSLLIVTNSQNNAIFDEEFTLLKDLDSIQSFSTKEEIFLETYIKNFLERSNSNFINEQIISNLKNSDLELNEREYIGCNIYNSIYFYNEKNIKEDDKDKSNAYCLVEIDSNYDDKIKNYIKNELEKEILNFFKVNKISLESLTVESNSQGQILVLIETKDTLENPNGKVSQIRNYEFKSSNSNLNNIISEIHKTFEGFSEKLNKEILSCYKENKDLDKEKIDIFCISKIYNDSLSEGFKKNYTVEILKTENFEDNDYLSFDFKITNKNTNNLELEFSAIFENKIPIGILDYTLNEYKNAENTIELNIKDLENQKIPEKYVIIYSYQNFLDKNTYSDYNKLIDIFEKSNFDSSLKSFLEINKNNYYHSSKENNMGLSVIMTPYENFDDNNNKKINIYQIYNKDTNSFELLNSNKEIYFLVFAIDNKNAYLTDEELLMSNLKSFVVDNQFGPTSISNINILKSQISTEEYFNFKIRNYYDINAASYDLYVFDSQIEKLDENGCSNYNVEVCEKVSSANLVDLNGEFLVTSNETLEYNSQDFKEVFKLNYLNLERGNKYNFLLIPVNSNGVGELVTRPQNIIYEKRIKKENDLEQDYFIEISNPLSTNRVTKFEIEMN